jgi:tRNA (guanine37-N1)-methyltransferase
MRFDIITLFPEMFESVFSAGVVGKAIEKRLLSVNVHNLRDFATDKHRQVDDRPFGGSPGMVLKPEPVFAAVERIRDTAHTPVFLLSPRGKRFDSRRAETMAGESGMILICGRYEGVDERVIQHLITDEVSIGDYILTGGEPAAMVVVDAVSRYVPGVVGKQESVASESFSQELLEHPQYTRPRDFRGLKVPEVLVSGNHEQIERWRLKRSLEKTWRTRPDLLDRKRLTRDEEQMLAEIKNETKGNPNESH